MEFNEKRFLQLAGIHSKEAANSSEQRTEPTERRSLTESAKRAPAASSDEQKLRALIRREAQKMISERAVRAANPDVARIQQKKSLTEAITMGFAGIGFGGRNGVLGGPMTSASRFASLVESEVEELDEAEGVEDEEGTLEADSASEDGE